MTKPIMNLRVVCAEGDVICRELLIMLVLLQQFFVQGRKGSEDAPGAIKSG